MKERGILFSADMVRAILEGRKTQTRRIINPQPPEEMTSLAYLCNNLWACIGNNGPNRTCPFGEVGDRLYVREAYAWADVMIDNVEREDAVCVAYRANNAILRHEGNPPLECDTYAINFEHKCLRWRPSIHMPKWAARIWLEITNVRVEKLQDITKKDILAEGVNLLPTELYPDINTGDKLKAQFSRRWDDRFGDVAWNSNPWVWAISFKRIVR